MAAITSNSLTFAMALMLCILAQASYSSAFGFPFLPQPSALPPLPQLPLPKLPTLPPLPQLPLPKLPSLPQFPLPTLPPLPQFPLPKLPTVPQFPLPTLSSLPPLPGLPTPFPTLPTPFPTLPKFPRTKLLEQEKQLTTAPKLNRFGLPVPFLPFLPVLPLPSLPPTSFPVPRRVFSNAQIEPRQSQLDDDDFGVDFPDNDRVQIKH